jgi:hypothetical protein
VENLDDLPGALDTLVRLHALRWPEGWLFQARAAFHRDFAAIALARGRLRLWCLELDGQPVVAWYGLRFAGVLPGGKRSSLGPSIGGIRPLTHSIRRAFDDGTDEYRFLRGQKALELCSFTWTAD